MVGFSLGFCCSFGLEKKPRADIHGIIMKSSGRTKAFRADGGKLAFGETVFLTDRRLAVRPRMAGIAAIRSC